MKWIFFIMQAKILALFLYIWPQTIVAVKEIIWGSCLLAAWLWLGNSFWTRRRNSKITRGNFFYYFALEFFAKRTFSKLTIEFLNISFGNIDKISLIFNIIRNKSVIFRIYAFLFFRLTFLCLGPLCSASYLYEWNE